MYDGAQCRMRPSFEGFASEVGLVDSLRDKHLSRDAPYLLVALMAGGKVWMSHIILGSTPGNQCHVTTQSHKTKPQCTYCGATGHAQLHDTTRDASPKQDDDKVLEKPLKPYSLWYRTPKPDPKSVFIVTKPMLTSATRSHDLH